MSGGQDWDDVPTGVTLRPQQLVARAPQNLQSFAEEVDPQDRTQQAALSSRGRISGLAGSALPEHVEAYLEHVSGPGATTHWRLATIRTVIGRGHQAECRLPDPNVSRKHASISYTGEEFRIRDENSSNGTFLNGSKVVEYAIRDADKLLVGDTLLRFRVGPRTSE